MRHLPLFACGVGLLAAVVLGPAQAFAQPVLQAAVSPNARTGRLPARLTVFAAVTNAGNQRADGCKVTSLDPVMPPHWLTLKPDNTFDGSAQDQPFAIDPGQTRNLLLTFTDTATTVSSPDERLDFSCGSVHAPSYKAVNTLTLAAADQLFVGADIIPIAITATGDGVIRLPAGPSSSGFMAVAAINNGADDTLVVRPGYETISTLAKPTLGLTYSELLPLAPVTLQICETDATGACLSPPVQGALTLPFASGQVRTFTVIVTADDGAGLPFFPDIDRVFVSFKRSFNFSSAAAGLASVAVTRPAPAGEASAAGIYNLRFRRGGDIPTDEWPMVAFVSPSGKFAAYGGSFNPSGHRMDLVGRDTVVTGQFALAQQGGAFQFSGANFPARLTGDTVGSMSGLITPRMSMEGAANPGSATDHRWTDASTFKGVAMTDVYNMNIGAGLAPLFGSFDLYQAGGTYRQPEGAGFILASGAMNGSFQGCVYTGTALRPTANRNLFELSMQFSACNQPDLSGASIEGLAAFYDQVFLPWYGGPTGQAPTLPLVAVMSPTSGASPRTPPFLIFVKTS